MRLEETVALDAKHNVSDLHLCNSTAPCWRRQGRLGPTPSPVPDIPNLLHYWFDAAQLQHWQEQGQIGFTLTLACGLRPRVSAFAYIRGISLMLRPLPEQCSRLETSNAPPTLSELLAEESGLLLVTGATGSGKSTTLVMIVGCLNQCPDGYILTLGDPVEFIHHNERCLILRREIGRHCPSLAATLRVALRQGPDVILLGELRDSETVRLVLAAAETGYLIMVTLHTHGTASAVERLIGVFPAEERDQVRSQLAGSLCTVLA